MSNIDDFNTIVGVVFSQLYESFPIPCKIHSFRIVASVFTDPKAPDVSPEERHRRVMSQYSPDNETPEEKEDKERLDSLYSVFIAAMDWLKHEGFIRTTTEKDLEYLDVVLSLKGLQALSIVPSGVHSSPLGQQIIESVKVGSLDGVRDLAKKAIGGLVSIITEAFARSLLTSHG